MSQQDRPTRKGTPYWRWVAILVVVAVLFVGARALPVETWIEGLSAWVDGLGVLGPAVFALR
jgi:uncharacterized membrane protein YdjX (TVP38/TMEM64 family)